MAVKIRLARHGKKGRPYYHIVIADARSPRDGRYIENIGHYNPNTNPADIEIDRDKAVDWLVKGAQPSDTCRAILSYTGVLYKKHLLGGVTKGAFDEAEADRRFEAWLKERDDKIQAKRDGIARESEEQRNARLAAEKKKAAEIAAAVSAKLAKAEGIDLEAATEEIEGEVAEGEAAPVEAAADAPVAEAPVAETPAAEEAPAAETPAAEETPAVEEAPATEAVADKPAEAPAVEEAPAAEAVVEEPTEAPVAEEAPAVEEAPVAEALAEEPAAEEAAPEPAPASAEADDLTKIEGIGPKIAETLVAAGVSTYADLAKTASDKIGEIIADVRGKHVPDTWPQQADLAANGKWDELKKLQDELDGGKPAEAGSSEEK